MALVVTGTGRRGPPQGRTSDDLELMAWTEDSRGYFHQYLTLPLPDARPSSR